MPPSADRLPTEQGKRKELQPMIWESDRSVIFA
jgi:hypothetical protein